MTVRQVRDAAYSVLTGVGVFIATFFITEFLYKPGAEFDSGDAVAAGFLALIIGVISGIVGAALMYRRLRLKRTLQRSEK
jgi:membrane associated rhomboid family serine protease